MKRPFIIGVGGFESNVGKTSLMCDLIREFPGWEAIKTTRGHYRSCGKDPHACCVSDMLGDEPVLLSGREATDVQGKDTGRYWSAGAANVHWLVVTDVQLKKGINEVLRRVTAPGVLIEGNSFTRFVRPDYFLMVKRHSSDKIKTSARRSLSLAAAVYVSDLDGEHARVCSGQQGYPNFFSRETFPALIEDLHNHLVVLESQNAE